MATTFHIPAAVLQTVDAQARKRKISRNKYIVEALIARVEAERSDARFPQSLFDDLLKWRTDPSRVAAIEAVERSVSSSRRSKKPIPL